MASVDGRVRSQTVALLVVVAVVLAGSLIVVSSALGDEQTHNTIAITDGACGSDWTAPGAGIQRFDVENQAASAADVELIGARNPLVYGSLEVVAAHTTRSLILRIDPGRYQWRCEFASGVTLLSPAATVTGTSKMHVHGLLPVTVDALVPVATDFRDRVTAGLTTLATDTDALRAAIDAGRIDEAKPLWLIAHLDYERLGAAYGTFDEFDARINGRPDGLVNGTEDANWSGFHRLERALWGGQPTAVAQGVADQLASDVHALVAAFPNQFTDARDLPLRAHEILESTLEFELTAATDQGSHTNLATARADVDGTRSVLTAITPLLATRDPKLLATATHGLDGLAALLDRYHQPDGSWAALQSLTRREREQLDAAVGQLVEDLAPIPDVLEVPRNPGQD